MPPPPSRASRYSELAALQAEVLRESGLAFALPPKRMFGNLDPEFIMARRQQVCAVTVCRDGVMAGVLCA